MKTLTKYQKQKLIKTCEKLFQQGTPSLKFMRILHNDYQIICNDDLNSPDNFFSINKIENKPMLDLLNELGYVHSNFGICKL